MLLFGVFAASLVKTSLWFDVPDGVSVTAGFISGAAYFALIVLAYRVADGWLRWTSLRCALAGLMGVIASVAVADAHLLSRMHIHVYEGAQVVLATGSVEAAMLEMGFDLTTLWAAGAVGLVIASFGAALRLGCPMAELRGRRRYVLTGIVAALSGVLVAEQHLSRTSLEYRFRDRYLPMYPILFDSGLHCSVPIPPPPEPADRRAAIAQLGPAKNPRHVLFIVLESFRRDAVTPEIAPHLERLSREGISLPGARTDSIGTLAAWNAMFMNRPAATASRDCDEVESRATGAAPLAMLAAAGYRLLVAFSTGLDYGRYRKRILGDAGIADALFLAEDIDAEVSRADRDDMVTREVIRWIGDLQPSEPSFLLVQFDGTHWKYTFDESRALRADYDPDPDISSLDPVRIEGLHNRAINASHQVDRNIGLMLAALRERGLLSQTAIVVVGDHGEGFRKGFMGHVTFDQPVLEIPMILKLPGVPAHRIEQHVSTGDAMATLLDYLEIEGFGSWMVWGHSLLRPEALPGMTLTTNGYQSRFVLSTRHGTLHMTAAERRDKRLHFVVVNGFDPSGRPVADLAAFATRLGWREALHRLLTRDRPPL